MLNVFIQRQKNSQLEIYHIQWLIKFIYCCRSRIRMQDKIQLNALLSDKKQSNDMDYQHLLHNKYWQVLYRF